MSTITKKLTKTLFILAGISLLLLTACKKMNLDKIATGAWNPNLAVPLAHANFDVYDVLARQDSSDLVVIDQNTGALALVYKGDVYSYDAHALVDVMDVNQNESLNFVDLNITPDPAYNGTTNSNNTKTVTFSANGSEIHEMKLKSGTLNLSISTDLAHDLTCKVTFPSITKNGVPVSTTTTVDYSGSTPQTGSSNIDLTDALADFTLGNTTFNKLKAEIEVSINGTGEPIFGNEKLDLNLGFSGLSFENAKGYFEQNNLGIQGDTVLLKLFQNAIDGYFELIKPKVRFYADNSFGFPVRLTFSDLKTINTHTGSQSILTGYPTVFDIDRPSAMGQTTTSEFELNTNNTNNLGSLSTSVPTYFVFFANTLSNPDGNLPPLNFITDKSELAIRTEVELPLEGSAYGFELKDTVDFNFNEDVSQLKSVMFRLNIDNGFPVELNSQVIFVDENYDSLFTVFDTPETVISPAGVDANGRVNQHKQKITDIHLNEMQIDKLPNVKYLLIKAYSQTLEGPTGKVVKIFDDYTVDLKLGLQVEGKVQL